MLVWSNNTHMVQILIWYRNCKGQWDSNPTTKITKRHLNGNSPALLHIYNYIFLHIPIHCIQDEMHCRCKFFFFKLIELEAFDELRFFNMTNLHKQNLSVFPIPISHFPKYIWRIYLEILGHVKHLDSIC